MFVSGMKETQQAVKVFRDAAEAVKGQGTMVLIDGSNSAICAWLREIVPVALSDNGARSQTGVEFDEEYRLQNETLCLAVSYVDRFLSFMSVVRVKLQLVGTAAMFVAAKYEEIYPPDVGEFVYITDDTYTKTQVLRMEQVLLKTLSFSLCVPTTVAFINMYANLLEMPDQLKHLTTYWCEWSPLEGEPYLKYMPSQVATAALALARHILASSKIEEVSPYSLASLKDIILHLCRTHNLSQSTTQQAIQEKYKSSKHMQVSTIQPVQLSEEQFDYLLKEYESKAVANENPLFSYSFTLPFRAKCPFSTEYGTNGYIFVYIFQSICTWFIINHIVFVDGISIIFIDQICLLLKILCKNFMELGRAKGKTLNLINELRELVIEHQTIIRITDYINRTQHSMFVAQVVCSTSIFCLTAFQITISREFSSRFKFAWYMLAAFMQMLDWCMFGSKVNYQSCKVADAVFNSMWIDFPPRVRKDLCLVILRAQKPLAIKASPFYDYNFKTLLSILRSSYSYFTLLCVLTNK